MKKITEEAWKKCPKCGKTKNQIKAGYNASKVSAVNVRSAASTTPSNRSGTSTRKIQRRRLVWRLTGVSKRGFKRNQRGRKEQKRNDSGSGVGKILKMNKSNVMNWIKKESQK